MSITKARGWTQNQSVDTKYCAISTQVQDVASQSDVSTKHQALMSALDSLSAHARHSPQLS
jgi:hypothetical protein